MSTDPPKFPKKRPSFSSPSTPMKEEKKPETPKVDEVKLEADIKASDVNVKLNFNESENGKDSSDEEISHQQYSSENTPTNTVPASHHMDKQLNSAEIAKSDIENDTQELEKIIKKYACNWVTLFYVYDQYWSKIRDFWRLSKPALLEAAKKAQEAGNWENEVEYKEPREFADLREFSKLLAILKEGIKELEAASSRANSLENNKILRETSKAILELTLVCTEKAVTICDFHDIKLTPNKETIANIERLLPIAAKEEYSIITVGLEKSGKSTFVNWLLGYDLLPMDERRCTMVTTLVKYRNSSTRLEVIVYFYDQNEFERNFKELRDNEKDGAVSSREKEIRETYSRITKREERITGNIPEIKQALQNWIGNEQKIFSVKKVEIYTNELFTEVPVEMIDVPGYDSVLENHRSMAREAIKAADAFIFVTAAERPNLTQPAINLMKDVSTHGGYQIFHKGFAILTKTDNVEVESKGKICIDTAKQGLRDFGIPDSHIFAACPVKELLADKAKKTALDAKEKERLDEVTRKSARYSELKDGATKAKLAIFNYLITELPKVRAKEAKKLAEDLIKNFFNKVEQVLKMKTGNQTSNNNVEASKESELVANFEASFQKSIEDANKFNWSNNLKQREEKFAEIIQIFQKNFTKSMEEPEARSNALSELAMKKETYGVTVDVIRLEVDERERLMKLMIKKSGNASQKISEQIYSMLHDLTYELVMGVGFRSVDDCPFKLENIISKDNCDAAIHALVMRVAFPAAIGVLRWPKSYPTRKSALVEMKIACPEIEHAEADEPKKEEK